MSSPIGRAAQRGLSNHKIASSSRATEIGKKNYTKRDIVDDDDDDDNDDDNTATTTTTTTT